MNRDTIKRLKDDVPFLIKYRALHKDEQKWIEPLLKRSIRTALQILDKISFNPLPYQQIADKVGLHHATVSQILNALADGGLRVILSKETAYAPIGRPRELVRR
jgi:DNA-binding transcriptional ArsR family regulator